MAMVEIVKYLYLIFFCQNIFWASNANAYNHNYSSNKNYSLKLDPNVILPSYNLSSEIGSMYILREDAFKYPVPFRNEYFLNVEIMIDKALEDKISLNSNKIYNNGEVRGYVIEK